MTVSRPMLYLSAAFIAGMYLIALFGATVACAVIFCVAVAGIIKAFMKRKRYDNLLLFTVIFVFIVGLVSFANTNNLRGKKLYPYLNQEVTVTGELTEDTSTDYESYLTMRLKLHAVKAQDGSTTELSEHLLLKCFVNKKTPAKIPVPKCGDVISVCATIEVPDGIMNAGGFDYATYLKTEKIFFSATGKTETFSVTGHVEHPVQDFFRTIRNTCRTLFDKTFPKAESGVLKAYILGDANGMDEETETETVFSISGLTHVLAVSGAHVVVFLSVITFFLTKLRIPKRWQLFLSAVLILGYIAFTGMSVSAVRAGFACFIAIVAQLFFKRSDPVTALFEAAAFLALWNPMVILSASFLLSFASTLGILLFGGDISEKFSFLYAKCKKRSRLYRLAQASCDILAIGIAAQLLTIPVLVYLFQSFSTLSVVATLLLTPLLSPLLAGGLLFCAVGSFSPILATPIAGFVYVLTKCMVAVAKLFAAIPFSRVSFGGLSPFILLVYGVLIVLIAALMKKKKHIFFVSLYSIASLVVVYSCHIALTYPVTKVSFVNVGQGDCALIQAPGNCDILIDAGGEEGNFSIAQNTVLPYIAQNHIHDIEYAVASHGHADHINGLIGLTELIKIKNLIVPYGFGDTEPAKMLLEKAEQHAIPVIFLKAGEQMQFENSFKLTAVLPDLKMLTYLDEDENNHSLVLKAEYGNTSFLFTGDISAEGEAYAAAVYPEAFQADVMKAAHHGSKTSNSEALLDAVSPKYVFIPVGRNSFGHPHETVLSRMVDRNIITYRADRQRDVTFYLDKTKICGIRYTKNDAIGG